MFHRAFGHFHRCVREPKHLNTKTLKHNKLRRSEEQCRDEEVEEGVFGKGCAGPQNDIVHLLAPAPQQALGIRQKFPLGEGEIHVLLFDPETAKTAASFIVIPGGAPAFVDALFDIRDRLANEPAHLVDEGEDLGGESRFETLPSRRVEGCRSLRMAAWSFPLRLNRAASFASKRRKATANATS